MNQLCAPDHAAVVRTLRAAMPADVIVIGAGVVGLAVARRLAALGRSVTVVEAESDSERHTSARGSWVIHSGIYYPPGSLKARLCQAGRHMLYEYCAAHGVAHRRLGKIIVATSEEQVPKLKALIQNAHANGASDVRWISVEEAQSMEPDLHCLAALYSPSTGIVDGKQLMQALHTEVEQHGSRLLFNTRVVGADVTGSEKAVYVEHTQTGERQMLRAQCIVNAAGLWAQHTAEAFAGFPRDVIPPLHLARGCYFKLKGKAPFKHLIYPMPEEAGLGTHLTLTLNGGAKFGPDSEWIAWDPDEGPDYAVDPARGEKFYAAIRKYWPELRDGALAPAYSGIRPKLAGQGQGPTDFMVQGPAQHGVPGLVNLFGVESPGLTSSLAIADMVAQLLDGTAPAAKL